MHHLKDPLFYAVFNQLPEARLVIKADEPHFTVIACNRVSVSLLKAKEDFSGKSLWSIHFPEAFTYDRRDLLDGLTKALKGKQDVLLPPFRHQSPQGDAFRDTATWYQIEISPIRENEETAYLILTIYDRTGTMGDQTELRHLRLNEAQLLAEQQSLNEELAASNEELTVLNEDLNESREQLLLLNHQLEERVQKRTQDLFMSEQKSRLLIKDAPVGICLLTGGDLIIESANDVILTFWGKTESVIGMPMLTALPDLQGQHHVRRIRDVLATGNAFYDTESRAALLSTEGLDARYYNIVYHPVQNESGETVSVMLVATDVSEQVRSKKDINLAKIELQQRQEELEALNEKLATSNGELLQIEGELQKLNSKLAESEDLFRGIFEQSPLGMCVLRGPDHIIAQANDNILKIWGRKAEDVIGFPNMTARPELSGQPVYDWLNECFRTGKTKANPEFMVYLYAGEGQKREAYVNSVYQPLRNATGTVYGILVIIDEVTERVRDRKQAEFVQEQFRLAVESAALGTWYIDAHSKELVPSPRLKELLGFRSDDIVSFDDVMALITDDHRQQVVRTIDDAIALEGSYDIEYSIKRHGDGKLLWLKATGRSYQEAGRRKAYFAGTVLDITGHKMEEIRKNDFIAMASHELKTPLTSAKAYVQMLRSKAKKAGDDFTENSLAKVEQQVNRMQSLISGFLDVARMEAGHLSLEIESFFLDELVSEVAAELALVSSQHEIVIDRNDPTKVSADRYKIAQVIDNLLRNAVKYSPGGGRIFVRCTADDQVVQVSVRDEGLGISAADMEGLFSRFYRVEKPHTAHISGFGVGLYICAQIIRRHNGNIWVESVPGEGSTFFFSVPSLGRKNRLAVST